MALADVLSGIGDVLSAPRRLLYKGLVSPLMGQDVEGFGDVLDKLGMEEGGLRSVLGFLGDVGTDPLTYAGAGLYKYGKGLLGEGAATAKAMEGGAATNPGGLLAKTSQPITEIYQPAPMARGASAYEPGAEKLAQFKPAELSARKVPVTDAAPVRQLAAPEVAAPSPLQNSLSDQSLDEFHKLAETRRKYGLASNAYDRHNFFLEDLINQQTLLPQDVLPEELAAMGSKISGVGRKLNSAEVGRDKLRGLLENAAIPGPKTGHPFRMDDLAAHRISPRQAEADALRGLLQNETAMGYAYNNDRILDGVLQGSSMGKQLGKNQAMYDLLGESGIGVGDGAKELRNLTAKNVAEQMKGVGREIGLHPNPDIPTLTHSLRYSMMQRPSESPLLAAIRGSDLTTETALDALLSSLRPNPRGR